MSQNKHKLALVLSGGFVNGAARGNALSRPQYVLRAADDELRYGGKKIAIFKGKTIRRAIYNDEWWFSVVDVCEALTDSIDAGAYWRKLKQRLKEEGSEVVTFCHGLKLARLDLEEKTKKKIVSKDNYINPIKRIK